MGLNVGFLISSKTPEHQEMYTPYYAVNPILKYIPKDKTIEGTPFASAYFCRNLLPKDLIIEHLEKYDCSLSK